MDGWMAGRGMDVFECMYCMVYRIKDIIMHIIIIIVRYQLLLSKTLNNTVHIIYYTIIYLLIKSIILAVIIISFAAPYSADGIYMEINRYR